MFKLSMHAREYIVAYRALAIQREIDEDKEAARGDESVPLMSAALIEKIVKLYKTHQNIIDQEKGWIKKAVDLMYKW